MLNSTRHYHHQLKQKYLLREVIIALVEVMKR